ncbi:MAG TPA: FmdB family zinc ribbon protein [Galbitalea sp.]|nr:FmdB family zinc ribbon protein [Galbitalea sp.]
MPTYSYKCTECGTAFDIQQAFTDDSLTVCPNCGGKLRKVFTAIGVTFNGSGFYRNDSRPREKSSESGAGSTGSQSESAGTKSAESKPAESKSSGSTSSESKSSQPKPAAKSPSTPAKSPTKTAG